MKLRKEQFLPAITTLSAKFKTDGNSWQDKIKEIDELGLEKVAIFPTCLNKEQRQEMYNLLEKTQLKEIPFVHLRSDMPPEELEYLIKKFNTQVFNTHSEKQYPLVCNLEKYRQQLFIENTFLWDEQEVKNNAGLCLDFSHLESDRLLDQKKYGQRLAVIKKYKIGCNHIAAVSRNPLAETENGKTNSLHFDKHSFQDLSEFDYLKNYPKEFFSEFCAIEVENSLKEQLKAIDYIYEICR